MHDLLQNLAALPQEFIVSTYAHKLHRFFFNLRIPTIRNV